MDYIYSGADRVLVWLGEEQLQDRFALEAIDKIHGFIDTVWPDGSLQDYMAKIVNNPDLPPNAWQHIGALFRRPYFQRLWVIQEVVKSKSAQVLCGDKIIPWQYLSLAFGLLAPGALRSACPKSTRHQIWTTSGKTFLRHCFASTNIPIHHAPRQAICSPKPSLG